MGRNECESGFLCSYSVSLFVVLPHQFYFSIRKVSVNIDNFIANVVYIFCCCMQLVCPVPSRFLLRKATKQKKNSCKQIEFHLDDAHTISSCFFIFLFCIFHGSLLTYLSIAVFLISTIPARL